jgi:TonB family protein
MASEKLAANLKLETGVIVLDHDQARAAARGAGYAGSINLSLSEARDLGAALGCDFFILGDAQTLRRSPSSGPVYFESYASIFVVSARTGRLINWERPSFQARTPVAAEQALLSELSGFEARRRSGLAIRRAQEDERGERELTTDRQVPIIEEAPDDDKITAAEGLRLPRPFRRLMPAYPETAARAEAEATVDVLVDLDANGEVTRVEVARWAGFGLDQTTVDTVRQLHFFPAARNGAAIPIRVLLRYNFRKPVK